MLGLGIGEILLIAIVLLVVVGPERLPKFMRTAGRIYGQMRRTADEMRRALVLEADRQDAEDRYQKLQERRRTAAEARKARAESADGEPADRMLPLSSRGAEGPSAGGAEPGELADRMLPAGARAPEQHVTAEASPPSAPPTGVSDAEWRALPEHIRQMLGELSLIHI